MEPLIRILFGLLLFVHGLIHFMGVAKAFSPEMIPQLSRNIPKPEGVLWLLSGLLLLAALALFILKKEWWPALAIVGVIISQFVISLSWEDAKFGTLANLLILSISIPVFGNQRFSSMVKAEISTLLSEVHSSSSPTPGKVHTNYFPPIVSRWMENSGTTTLQEVHVVYLRQKGKMRTKSNGKWMPFQSAEYFRVKDPGFVWSVKVAAFPFIHLVGRDKFHRGKGDMLIKILSLFKVVDESDDEQMNTGTMLRFLGEICWFPSAAREPYLSWESLDETSARATMELDGQVESGIFRFTPDGKFVSFEAMRYYGGGKMAVKRPWIVQTKEYKVFEGIKIPAVCEVTWKLPEGNFTWLQLEITHLEYDPEHPIPVRL